MLCFDYSWILTSFCFFFVISLDCFSYVLVHNVVYKQSAIGRLQNWMVFICCWSFVFPAPFIPQATLLSSFSLASTILGWIHPFCNFQVKAFSVLFFFIYNINLYQLLKVSLSSVPSNTEQDMMTLISLFSFSFSDPFLLKGNKNKERYFP